MSAWKLEDQVARLANPVSDARSETVRGASCRDAASTSDWDEALLFISALFRKYETEISAEIKDREIEILLLAARPRNGDLDHCTCGAKDRRVAKYRVEEQRVEAVRELRALYQSPPVDNRVQIFFDENWRRILSASDPVAAAREFFNGKAQRGRRPDSEERNLRIAVAVQKETDAGMTVEQACKQVRLSHAREIGSWERIREIYYGPANEEAKKDWQFTIGARQPTAVELLSAIKACCPMAAESQESGNFSEELPGIDLNER